MVSDQPLPNILPVLHPDLKPEKVYLLCSQEQKKLNNDQAQKKIIEECKCVVDVIYISSAFDIDGVGKQTEEILNNYDDNEKLNILLNATGGTKPMSIAAFEQCVPHDIGVFYVQTPKKIIWLYEPKKLHLSNLNDTIPNRLSLQQFLEAHCLDLLESNTNRIPQRTVNFVNSWAKRAGKYKNKYSTLNYYSSQANNNLHMQIPRKGHHENLSHLLGELERGGYIKHVGKPKHPDSFCYEFPSEEKRSFVNGGWLEEYVFNQLQSLQDSCSQITDVARNVKVRTSRPSSAHPHHSVIKHNAKNELDVIAIVNHRMWVFECKTRRYSQSPKNENRQNRDGEEMIYKLAGIMKNMGGIRTRGCVVSFNTLRDEEKSRANLLDIDVIDGRNLKENTFRSILIEMLEIKA